MRIFISAAAAVTVLGLTAGLATDAEAAKKKPGKCAMIGGQGTGIGQDLAKQNAAMAVKEAMGSRKGMGKVSYKCSSEAMVLTTCTAKQRAC